MFPTGIAGAALVVLRSLVAVTVLADSIAWWTPGSVQIVPGVAALVALCLIPGFLTPYGAAACCVLELALVVMTSAPDRFHLVVSAFTAAVTVVPGPGAYSVDARLFGRKLIKIPPTR